MQIDSMNGPAAAREAASADSVTQRTGLGQEDFLKMLLTQLEHQDPLEPQDPTEFTAQLAQFTSLEQLVGIKEGIDGLGAPTESPSDLAALASLVGRDVLVRSDQLEVGAEGEAAPFELSLEGPASSVRVTLLDASGSVVRSIEAGSLGEGRHVIAWDGMRQDGTPLAAGRYTLRAEALNGANASHIDTLVQGTVRAVEPAGVGGEALLEVGARRVPASDILEVRRAASAS